MPVNTAALKTFAPAMRRQLLEAMGRKLDLLLHSQTPDTLSTYAKQIAELREQEEENREQLLERVAYTWFNRLCALRYLDARGWHPFGCKVLMPAAEGETQPELLKLMRAGSLPAALKGHANESRLHGLLDEQIQTAIAGADPQGEVYRELLLATCRFYHELLPNLFEGLDDAGELLLPDDLLSEGSIAGSFRREISDDDCQDVEILGWLYQFYIAEKKDEVMARKKAVPTEDIPAVTQLFTPHWIVRYLVENSLGRLWLLNRPFSGLKSQMSYYIDSEAETDFLKINKPEEIKLLDPACGSGHMLTYAFDLLTLIYEEEGYAPSEIPALILQHNLHGLEICPRAAQLAELALVFKAREKSRRFFQQDQLAHPQILELQDVRFEEDELNPYIQTLDLGEPFDQDLLKLLHQFEEAKNFGSLIQPCLDERAVTNIRGAIEAKEIGDQLFLRETHLKVLRVLKQAEALTQRYHIAVANPPYMGRGSFSASLRIFAKENYDSSGPDLYGFFLVRTASLVRKNGLMALVTMNGWMFLGRFEKCRKWLLKTVSLTQLLHMGARAFDSLSGGVVQAAAALFFQRAPTRELIATFIDARKGSNEKAKEQSILNLVAPRYHRRLSLFLCVPGAPLAHWLSDAALSLFADLQPLSNVGTPRCGMITGSNAIFVRNWHEVSHNRCGFGIASREAAKASGRKWFPYLKGGGFRKWIGNEESVVNWENDGFDLRTRTDSKGHISAHAFNEDYIFKPSLNWNKIMGDDFGVRLNRGGFMFDDGSAALFPKEEDLEWCAGFLNSVVSGYLLHGLNPTVNIQAWDVGNLPVCKDRAAMSHKVSPLVSELTKVARNDWDSFETSWDFRTHPFLQAGQKYQTLEIAWRNLEMLRSNAILRMQELETENNRIFIAAYGLDGELSPAVHKEKITLARPDQRKDIASFLSYAIGCMIGRYSLNQSGLILADSRDSQSAHLAAYEEKVGKTLSQVLFKPDPDGIIPVLDGEWFEDDIVARTREFLVVTFTESSVGENLRFIEESLGKDIRKYFCSEFYKDHLQTYKKRPIYWMVQSPKKGFACLIYLHRYTKDTLNQVLNNYFRPYLQKLEARLAQLGLDQLNDDLPTRERTAARKEAEKITKVLKECQAWEQDALLPLAQQRIELDLDDGVKVNYLKLQDVLAPIPGLAAKED
jgi:hypothetical protein